MDIDTTIDTSVMGDAAFDIFEDEKMWWQYNANDIETRLKEMLGQDNNGDIESFYNDDRMTSSEILNLFNNDDIDFLRNIAFGNTPASDKILKVKNRIWPTRPNREEDAGRKKLAEFFKIFLPKAYGVNPDWFKYVNSMWVGTARHFCLVLVFIERLLSTDVWLLYRQYMHNLPTTLIPLNELEYTLTRINDLILYLMPREEFKVGEQQKQLINILNIEDEEEVKTIA